MSTPSPTPPAPNPEALRRNVEFLLGHAQELTKAERERTTSLDGKATSIVAISGVILGLTATVGKDIQSLEGTAHSAARIGHLVALVFLLVAIGTAARAIWPRPFLTFSMLEVQQYATRGYLTRQPLLVQGTTLKGLVKSMGYAREVNQKKVRWLYCAFIAFFLGLSAAVAVAVAFTWRSEGDATLPMVFPRQVPQEIAPSAD